MKRTATLMIMGCYGIGINRIVASLARRVSRERPDLAAVGGPLRSACCHSMSMNLRPCNWPSGFTKS